MQANETILPDGVLLVNKHAGVTSHDIVGKVRRLYGTRAVGHAGTLDPMATGVLVVLVGRAAKACEYVSHDRKIYRATLRLGVTTDTEDITGQVADCVVLVDNDGEAWVFEGDGYEVGQLVIVVFDDMGTDDIYDDEIVEIRG